MINVLLMLGTLLFSTVAPAAVEGPCTNLPPINSPLCPMAQCPPNCVIDLDKYAHCCASFDSAVFWAKLSFESDRVTVCTRLQFIEMFIRELRAECVAACNGDEECIANCNASADAAVSAAQVSAAAQLAVAQVSYNSKIAAAYAAFAACEYCRCE